MKAFILSAGLGKRLLPHTLKTPKPCMLFLKTPLVAFNLQHLLNIGVTEFIFNTHHLKEQVQETVTKLLQKKTVSYHFSYEKALLNSAGGLKKIASLLDKEQDFLMINADSLCLGNSIFLQKSIDFHKQHKALATLLCCPSPNKSFKTIEVNQNNQVLNIGPISENYLHYAGYMVISSQIFSLIKIDKAHIFTDVLLPYIKNTFSTSQPNVKKVFANYTPSWKFFEMGNEKDFKSAEKECKDILSSNNLELKNYLKQTVQNFSD
ncbi:MAG: hypothetical protein HAW63_01275 [Bdellovibrionaceae bacterium]|nr:hypothetical protein [Pseudobdellovibrionaceae bacterium]